MIFLYKNETGDICVSKIERCSEISEEAAIKLAATIVFLADGNLVKSMENGKVVEWNTDAALFKEYLKLLGLQI